MIDYSLLAEAERYYKSQGFQRLEVPWVVEEEHVLVTLPEDKKPCLLTDGRALVGSGEQAFLALVNSSFLTKEWQEGKFMAITPCFRDEKVIDKFTRPYFMKLELFNNIDLMSLSDTIECALAFFRGYLDAEVIKTAEGYDIIDSELGYELGSYGIRSAKGYGKWIFGTGLAEPRFSSVRNSIMSKFVGSVV